MQFSLGMGQYFFLGILWWKHSMTMLGREDLQLYKSVFKLFQPRVEAGTEYFHRNACKS
jgi:hypothetical protein